MWKLSVALLFVGIGVALGALTGEPDYTDGCYPRWAGLPRPDCSQDSTDTMHNWKGMMYIYVAKKLSKAAAEKFCGPFDEAVCRGEYTNGEDQRQWRTNVVSTPLENEMGEAVIPAFEKACIKAQYKGNNWFWSGATKFRDGKLVFSDRSRTSTFSVDPWIKEGEDCVAFDDKGGMHLVKCSEKLPFICKIQPASH